MRYPPVNQAPYQPMNQQYSGLNQNYSGMPSPNYPQPPAQQKSQRKLDPDMLPNPVSTSTECFTFVIHSNIPPYNKSKNRLRPE